MALSAFTAAVALLAAATPCTREIEREFRRQRLERDTLDSVVGRTMGECQFSGGENQCVEVRSLNLSFWWSSDQWFIALGARSAPVAELGGGFY